MIVSRCLGLLLCSIDGVSARTPPSPRRPRGTLRLGGAKGDKEQRRTYRFSNPASAIRATAHKLSKLFRHLMTSGEAYRRVDPAQEEARQRERRLVSLRRRRKSSG